MTIIVKTRTPRRKTQQTLQRVTVGLQISSYGFVPVFGE